MKNNTNTAIKLTVADIKIELKLRDIHQVWDTQIWKYASHCIDAYQISILNNNSLLFQSLDRKYW